MYVEKPVVVQQQQQQFNYEYGIQVPAQKKDEQTMRYLFDVRVEKPVEAAIDER